MRKPRVLVVDDLPDVCTTLCGLLSDEGYEVFSASTRAEALRILEKDHFHVAILDVRLDESDEENRDGLLLMREIRERSPDTAVIILTGYADVKMVREALQPDETGFAPAFGFLEKCEVEQLSEYVRRALERRTPSARELIAQGENEHVEFKSSLRWDFERRAVDKRPQEAVAATIAGMLNADGGYLLIGVADDGTILGIDHDLRTLHKRDTDGFCLALEDIIKNYLGSEYLQYIRTRFESVEGKQVCIVSVRKSPQPVFFSKGDAHIFWIRAGHSTRSLDVKATTDYIQMHWGKQATHPEIRGGHR